MFHLQDQLTNGYYNSVCSVIIYILLIFSLAIATTWEVLQPTVIELVFDLQDMGWEKEKWKKGRKVQIICLVGM